MPSKVFGSKQQLAILRSLYALQSFVCWNCCNAAQKHAELWEMTSMLPHCSLSRRFTGYKPAGQITDSWHAHADADLSLSCAGDAAIYAAEGIALLHNGCLEDVQHDSRLTEDERPVALCYQLRKQRHHEGCLAGRVHSCTQHEHG